MTTTVKTEKKRNYIICAYSFNVTQATKYPEFWELGPYCQAKYVIDDNVQRGAIHGHVSLQGLGNQTSWVGNTPQQPEQLEFRENHLTSLRLNYLIIMNCVPPKLVC